MIRQYMRLPSPEAAQPLSSEFVALLEEHRASLSAARSLRGEHEKARSEVEQARRRDEDARTVAMREGKPDPGPVNETKAKEKLQKVEDEGRLRAGVVGKVESDLAKLITKEREQWTQQLREQIAEDNKALRSLFDEAAVLLTERAAHKGLLAFIDEGSASYNPEPHPNEQAGLALRQLIGSTVQEEPSEAEIVVGHAPINLVGGSV